MNIITKNMINKFKTEVSKYLDNSEKFLHKKAISGVKMPEVFY